MADNKFEIKLNNFVNNEIRNSMHSGEYFRDVLDLNSRIYDKDFLCLLAIHGQKPDATFVASYDDWKKYNRHVKRNTHSAYAFGNEKYLFDVTDTDLDNGKTEVVFGWGYADNQVTECLGISDLKLENEEDKKKINTLFSDRISSIIKKKNNAMISEGKEGASERILNLAGRCATYILYRRLGLSVDRDMVDFSDITHVSGGEFLALGQLANETAANVISDVEKGLVRIVERGDYYDKNDKDAGRGRDDRRTEGEVYGREGERVVLRPGTAGVLSDRTALGRFGGTEAGGRTEESRADGGGRSRGENDEPLRQGMDGLVGGREQPSIRNLQADGAVEGESLGYKRGGDRHGVGYGNEGKNEENQSRENADGYIGEDEGHKADYGDGKRDSESRVSVSDALDTLEFVPSEDLPFKDDNLETETTADKEKIDTDESAAVSFDIENEIYEKEKRESENVAYTQLSLFDFLKNKTEDISEKHDNEMYDALYKRLAGTEIAEKTEIIEENNEKITEESLALEHEDTEKNEPEILADYHYDLSQKRVGGEKVRFGWNIAAIKTLKKIESEGRHATADEQEILAKYVGWGGLAAAFDERNVSWRNDYNELKELLTDEEYAMAKSTVTDAFYTSPYIAGAVTDIIKKLGFDGGNILEPSMGIGNFFGSMDKDIFDNSRLYGVEIDSISGRIAKQLYQTADIQIKGYQDTEFSDNFFDVAIGNVPFGSFGVYDSRYKEKFLIHDYFFAKTLDKVRPGGLVAFITSKGTMDKANNKVRKYINERAEFVGAVRLPNTAFKDTAGTEVTSDIIILKKRDMQQIVESEWIDLDLAEGGVAVNSYFASHPDMMIGTMAKDTGRFGENSNYTTCIPHEGADLEKELRDVIENNFNTPVYEKLKVLREKEDEEVVTIPADPNVRNFTNVIIDGDVYYRENSVMTKVAFRNKKDEGRLKGIIRLNDVAREIIRLQLDGCTEEELTDARNDLNRTYDEFVKEYGYISSGVNGRLAGNDDNYQFLTTLEEKDEKDVVHKSDFFTKSTITPKREITEAENAHEALMYSLNEKGVVDLEYMHSLYSPTAADEEGSYAAIVDELAGAIYLNPECYDENDITKGWETEDEYLSGNVRRKLVLAQSTYDECENEQFKAYFKGCVDALERVQPEKLTASEIEVKLGTAWIELEDYEQFIYDKFHVPGYHRKNYGFYYGGKKVGVERDKATMTYYIANKSVISTSVASTQTYGTRRMSGLAILEKTLNFKQATVWEHDDKGNRWINQQETTLAREKQEILKEEFKEWFWSNDERREKYVEFYNREYNNTRLREYNGDFFEFPGMNKEIELMPHQRNAVARTLFGGNTLLAHCVGAGKSFEMIASCMEKKRLGFANKPMMVVPNAIVQQTKNEFLRLYPNANLLVAGKDDFSPKKRKRFVSKIATGDYDCVIIAHSQFERIRLSTERVNAALQKQIDGLVESKMETKDNWTVKQIEGYIKSLKNQIEKNNEQEKKDDVINFDSLGVDCLYVDEAHNYKNMAIYSKISNVAGIPTGSSLKANDMKLKCDYISEISGNKNLIFATGTPISNTMAEMYVMQSYLQGKRLERAGVGVFDSWVGNFGEVTTSLELKAEGRGFKFRNRFNKYVNLPELVTMFKEVADIKTADTLDLDVPKIKGGKAYVVEAEMDEYMEEYLDNLVDRAEMVANGCVKPNEDNYLKITNEGRLLGTDLRLIIPDAPVNPNGKLIKVAENVYKEYEENNRDGKIGCQLVFSDIGVPNSKREFDVYNCVKNDLIKMGIPENEIAFIHDAGTDAAKKDALFKKVRAGEIKVLFGSTDKCGTGVNVQTHLVAMHHIDCPWKPSSIEQRDGRGIRQGNENKEVAIYRYVTKGTFDAYSWSLIENKQRFISQVMTSKPVGRNCDDIDETVLNAAEIKALATGDTTIKEKMELDNDVSRLKLLKSQFDKNRDIMIENANHKYPAQLSELNTKIKQVEADLECKNENPLEVGEDGKPVFAMEIQGKVYDSFKTAGEAIAKARLGEKINIPIYLGKYRGFKITGTKLPGSEPGDMEVTLHQNASYRCTIGLSSVGNVTKIVNVVDNIETVLDNLQKKRTQLETDLEQAKKECEKVFPHTDELKEKTHRLNELNAKLMVGQSKGEILDEDDTSIEDAVENVCAKNEVEVAKKPMVM